MGLRVIQGPHSSYLPKNTMLNVPFSNESRQEAKNRGNKTDKTKSANIEEEIISTNGKL